jgi:hypothetical protein
MGIRSDLTSDLTTSKAVVIAAHFTPCTSKGKRENVRE